MRWDLSVDKAPAFRKGDRVCLTGSAGFGAGGLIPNTTRVQAWCNPRALPGVALRSTRRGSASCQHRSQESWRPPSRPRVQETRPVMSPAGSESHRASVCPCEPAPGPASRAHTPRLWFPAEDTPGVTTRSTLIAAQAPSRGSKTRRGSEAPPSRVGTGQPTSFRQEKATAPRRGAVQAQRQGEAGTYCSARGSELCHFHLRAARRNGALVGAGPGALLPPAGSDRPRAREEAVAEGKEAPHPAQCNK